MQAVRYHKNQINLTIQSGEAFKKFSNLKWYYELSFYIEGYRQSIFIIILSKAVEKKEINFSMANFVQ